MSPGCTQYVFQAVAESPSLRGFKRRVVVALGDTG